MKKHLVYAEDLLYEIMQHPSSHISKRLIQEYVAVAIKEHEVRIMYHIFNCIKGWFSR